MCPITETRKKTAPTQVSELNNLQKHGMSEDSIRGRDEIRSLVGERGKGSADSMQSFVRNLAKGFFSRIGSSKAAPSSGAKKDPATSKKP